MPKSLSLKEAVEKHPVFRDALDYIRGIRNFLFFLNSIQNIGKAVPDLAAYSREEDVLSAIAGPDRVFPLENTIINEFELAHDRNAPVAFVHDGYQADELARSMNALAVTVGQDIYFRQTAYNPGSEEGRKLLAHELTHVAQFGEKRLSAAREDLEAEAFYAENNQKRAADTLVTIDINGKLFRFPASQKGKVVEEMAQGISGWLTRMETMFSENDYLSCLSTFAGWLKGRLP